MNKTLKLLLLLTSFTALQACAQKATPNYFELDFSGHHFENVSGTVYNEHALRQGLNDNTPRQWYQAGTTQLLITKSGIKDTLVLNFDIDFRDSRGGIPPVKIHKGSYPLAQNSVSVNSDSYCPFPEDTVGPFIEIYTTSNHGTDSKIYKSGSYNFHKDTGTIVIDELVSDDQGNGYIAGHFEGTVSYETTTIDTHADEHAICKKENYKYETLPLKGKFRLKLKSLAK